MQKLLESLTNTAIALAAFILELVHAPEEEGGGLAMPIDVLARYTDAMVLLSRGACWAVALSARLEAGIIVPLYAMATGGALDADDAAFGEDDATDLDDNGDDDDEVAAAVGDSGHASSSLRMGRDAMVEIARLPDLVVLDHIREDLIAAAKILGRSDLMEQVEALAVEAAALLAARPEEVPPDEMRRDRVTAASGLADAADDAPAEDEPAPAATGRGPPGSG